jgi:hypothetical protein
VMGWAIVVHTSADAEKLRSALSLTWPGGVCTDTGITTATTSNYPTGGDTETGGERSPEVDHGSEQLCEFL